MWTSYSTKDTADVVGLSQSVVRSCVREGLLDASPDSFPLRFTFQDLRVLSTIRDLRSKGVSLRRVRRQLRSLKKTGVSLSTLAIEAWQGNLVVSENEQRWRADSGQMVFDFEVLHPELPLQSLPSCQRETRFSLPYSIADAPEDMDADKWFALALQIEEESPEQSIAAYSEVLRLRPDNTECLINQGRLHAESEGLDAAKACFERALEIDPREPTALYNLGVIAQDTGNDRVAIEYYEAALSVDRALAEAHYNLATIFDKSGDARSAIRHINEFRKLSKRRP